MKRAALLWLLDCYIHTHTVQPVYVCLPFTHSPSLPLYRSVPRIYCTQAEASLSVTAVIMRQSIPWMLWNWLLSGHWNENKYNIIHYKLMAFWCSTTKIAELFKDSNRAVEWINLWHACALCILYSYNKCVFGFGFGLAWLSSLVHYSRTFLPISQSY